MRKFEMNKLLMLALGVFVAACSEQPTERGALTSPAFAKGGAAACPAAADFVVDDEANLLAALIAASPGDVIGLDGFFEVSANFDVGGGTFVAVLITTEDITITCATAGAGLFSAGGFFSLLWVVSDDVRVDRLTLDGTGVTTAAIFIPGDRPTFSNNHVTCGLVCVWFQGSTGPVITDNHFDASASGVFSAIQIQAGTTDALVKGNNVVGSGVTGIRIRSGANYVVDHNTVVGPWRQSMVVIPTRVALTGSQIKSNHLQGATEFGLAFGGGFLGGGGGSGLPATDNVVRNNRITGAGEAGVSVNVACANTFLGNNLNGNANDIGVIFVEFTGANALVGNKNVVVDNGDFDCDGDGEPDPNIITGRGAVLNGVNLGEIISEAVVSSRGIVIQ